MTDLLIANIGVLGGGLILASALAVAAYQRGVEHGRRLERGRWCAHTHLGGLEREPGAVPLWYRECLTCGIKVLQPAPKGEWPDEL